MRKLISPFVVFIASFAFPFTYWPEMLNWPFIMSRGWLPYRDFSIIHTPVLPMGLMAFYKLVGFSPAAMHLAGSALLFLANLAVVILITKITKNWKLAVTAGFVHAFLSLAFEGNTVWFESLLTPLLIAAFWLQYSFLTRRELKRIFLSGVLMGVIFLTKQTALFVLPEFFVFTAYLYYSQKFKKREIAKVTLVFFTPIVISGLVFAAGLEYLGIFPDFINWSVVFVFLWTSLKNSDLPSSLVSPTLRQGVMLLTFFGMTLFLTVRAKRFLVLFLFIWIWLLTMMIFPRFEYFHLLPMLPFLTALIFTASGNKKNLVGSLAFLLFFTLPIMRNTYRIGQRFLTPEVISVSDWIRENEKGKTLFSLNGPDLVYFLTKTTPAVKPWIDQLPWELSFAGDKFTTTFKKARPEIIVFHPYLAKPVNGVGAYQPKEIVEFVKNNYSLAKTFPDGVEILKRNE